MLGYYGSLAMDRTLVEENNNLKQKARLLVVLEYIHTV
jgi:hypothetical protein